ncbi:MAG: ABC transporter ATP-binding protein [Leptolinea sp.]|jgi:NitT/TauT family transport system ATP-binding protein|nr:ABC transporter ATP-binding protein [Leptolinea sp.]
MDDWIRIQNLCKSFGTLSVIDHWSIDIKKGERLVILGPSGCGKTTFLKILAGLEKPTSGAIDHLHLRMGFVFQESRLIPWLTVKKNLLFINSEDNLKILDSLYLSGFEDYLPSQLSGGMRQRVNLARALANRPEFLLMDEAFRSLDWGVKIHIIDDINTLWRNSSFTLITVTHDPREAYMFADRVVVLSSRPARIVKIFDFARDYGADPPAETYLHFESEIMNLLSSE